MSFDIFNHKQEWKQLAAFQYLLLFAWVCAFDVVYGWACSHYQIVDEVGLPSIMAAGSGQLLIGALLTLIAGLALHSSRMNVGKFNILYLSLLWLMWLTLLGCVFHKDDITVPLFCFLGYVLALPIYFIKHKISLMWQLIFMLAAIIVILVAQNDFYWANVYGLVVPNTRWRGLWLNPNTYGTIAGLCVLWSMWQIAQSANNINERALKLIHMCVSSALLLVSLLGLYKSQCRAVSWCLVLVFLGSAAYCASVRKLRMSEVLSIMCFGFIVMCALCILHGSMIESRLFRLPSLSDGSIYNRLLCWKYSLNFDLASIVFGKGWGFHQQLVEPLSKVGLHDHRASALNDFVQVTVARGVLGVVLITIIIIRISYVAWKQVIMDNRFFYYMCILGLLALILSASFFNNFILNPALSPVFWAIMFNYEKFSLGRFL